MIRNEKKALNLYRIESVMYAIVAFLLGCSILLIMFSDHTVLVSGISMNPTYQDGDCLKMEKISNIGELAHGDVIVLKRPDCTAELIIKRVIGLPGDKLMITCRGVYVNGNLLENDFPTTYEEDVPEIITIGDNEVFVMGDNRDHSVDSRYFGTADFSLVKYKVTEKLEIVGTWLFSICKQFLLNETDEQLENQRETCYIVSDKQSELECPLETFSDALFVTM